MGFIRGLAAINETLERPKSSGDYQKVTWLKLDDGQSVKVRFPNELDEDSPNFDEARGTAVVVAEHTSPNDYRIKAVCTREDDGRCYACELHQKENSSGNKEYKGGWKPRLRYYTNVLVDNGSETFVAVWSQGVSTKSAFNILREQAMETGSISNVSWKVKRNGTGTQTQYVLIPSAPDSEPYDWGELDLFNLDKVVRQVPYAEQENFYMGFSGGSGDATSSTSLDW